MRAHKQSRQYLLILTGLLVLMLVTTAMTGCRASGTVEWTNQSTEGTVNSTFVNVHPLLAAPTKVVMSYQTEELNLGGGQSYGVPQFLDGVFYTFSYRARNEYVWMTAWDQAMGKRLWSVDTGLRLVMPLVSDGKHLFLHFNSAFCCLDRKTGATVWESTPTAPSPFVLDLSGKFVLHINKQNNVADRLYVLGAEMRDLDTGRQKRNPGIYILDGANGKLLGRIGWPAFTPANGSGELLCDGPALYATIPESMEGEYPAKNSSLVAFDLTTNKVMWQESLDGEGSRLIKQDNMLVLTRGTAFFEDWIDVWQVVDTTTPATRLWTRKIEHAQSAFRVFCFAVTSSFVFLQGEKGMLLALNLASGQETWHYEFAPTEEPVADSPDMTELHDTYQLMTITPVRDALYVQDGDDLVAVFDYGTGKKLWSKRIPQIVANQTSVACAHVMQVVDKGIAVVMSDGTVSILR